MLAFVEELFPICRSITGDGSARPSTRSASGSRWSSTRSPPARRSSTGPCRRSGTSARPTSRIRAAGESWTSADHNLHVVGYSVPVDARMPLSELREHIHTLPDQPDLIPYRTSYYAEAWGFCMATTQLRTLADGSTTSVIDSSLEPGSLTYGELFLPGETEAEVLISCHCCHPSLANDNLSGSRSRRGSPSTSQVSNCGTRTDSCSSPARSDRSPGWRGTRSASAASSTVWS